MVGVFCLWLCPSLELTIQKQLNKVKQEKPPDPMLFGTAMSLVGYYSGELGRQSLGFIHKVRFIELPQGSKTDICQKEHGMRCQWNTRQ